MTVRKLLFSYLILALVACGPKKVKFRGPGHDADWPIEDPNSAIYSDYLKAKHYSDIGKVDAAIDAYEDALKHNNQVSMIYQGLGFEWYRKGDLIKAEKNTLRAIELDSKSWDNFYLMGKIYSAKQNWKEAEKYFKKAMVLDSEREEESIIALSTVYMESRQSDRALALLEKYSKDNPQSLFGYYYLGRIYGDLGKPNEALQAYQKALVVNPSFTAALKAVALIYEYQGKKKEAIATFEQILDSEPRNTQIQIHLSQLYLEDKNFEKAKKNLEEIVDQEPENRTARLRLGLIYLQEENYKESEKIFRHILKDSPQKSQAHYFLGVVLERQDKLQDALKEFEAVEAGSDNYIESRMAEAFIYEQLGKAKKGEEIIREVMAIKGDDPSLVASLASNLRRQKRSLEARSLLETSLAKSPKNETLLYSLGETFEALADLKSMESTMRKVLEINPDNASALNFLGYTFAEKGIRLDEAEKMILRAVEISPKDGYILDSLGWVYFQKKDFGKAQKYLEQAHALSDREPTIIEHLGDLYFATAKYARAKEMYSRALQYAKDPADRERLNEKLKKLAKK